MKITDIETQPVVVPLAKPVGFALGKITCFGCVLVTVRTDQGLVGENLVFTLNDIRTRVFVEMIDSLKPLLIDTDPAFTGRFWAEAWRGVNFIGHKGVSVVGLSALDGALWDLNAKAAGLPLFRMLGGVRTHVPAYHSGGLWLSASLSELEEEAGRMVEEGFKAIKLRLGAPTAGADRERVALVRRVIGPSIKLLTDANQSLTENEAIRRGRMLEEFDITWFEEPLPAWDLEGLARVKAAISTPVASGETDYTRYAFRRMLELRSADILMPDLQRVGGVSEFMKVGHLAEAFDVPVSSHLFPETSIQLLAALANVSFLEYMPWFSDLYEERLEFAEGEALVPERPGWGFSFNQDYIAHLRAKG